MDGKRAWGGQTGGAIKKPSEYIDNVVDVLEARRLRVSVKEHKDFGALKEVYDWLTSTEVLSFAIEEVKGFGMKESDTEETSPLCAFQEEINASGTHGAAHVHICTSLWVTMARPRTSET